MFKKEQPKATLWSVIVIISCAALLLLISIFASSFLIARDGSRYLRGKPNNTFPLSNGGVA